MWITEIFLIKSVDIYERTFQYSLRAIKLYEAVKQSRHSAGDVLCRQYLRSATSIGANVQEAQHAESKSDFIHKLSIARKEARESHYWLRLLCESEIVAPKRLAPLLQETTELIAVLTGIILSAKRKNVK